MDEDLGSSFITIEDEDGNEFELEQLATMEYNGQEYSAFLPADMDEDDPDYGYIILRIEEENGEELFCSVDEGPTPVGCVDDAYGYERGRFTYFGKAADENSGMAIP